MKAFRNRFSRKSRQTGKPPGASVSDTDESQSVEKSSGIKGKDWRRSTITLPPSTDDAPRAQMPQGLPRRTTGTPPGDRAKFVDPKTGSMYRSQLPTMRNSPKRDPDEKSPLKAGFLGMKQPPLTVSADTVLGQSSTSIGDDFIESPLIAKAYEIVPILEQTKLPRGGISVETKAVGRVQFGIPPETIKDSMRLGIPVPQVYIVPVERFCREMGPALGVNLAEFEFPAYFNYFVYKKKCTLVVDSKDAEENIRRVFSETLLGPEQFRTEDGISHEEEDFAPDFPRDAMPNFQKELKHFRIMPDGHELVIETLLDFCHYEFLDSPETFGVPPQLPGVTDDDLLEDAKSGSTSPAEGNSDDIVETEILPKDLKGVERREEQTPWTFAQATGMGDVARVYPSNATPEQIKKGCCARVEIFKMPGGTEYIIHDIDENNRILGKAKISGHVRVSEFMSVDGFGGRSFLDAMDPTKDELQLPTPNRPLPIRGKMPSFHPPSFGVTVLGNSHGFDKSGSVSGYVLWINGRGVMIDPPPYSSATLEREGIRPRTIVGIILTHCHADHDAGAFQKVLTGSPVVVITTPTIYKSFIRKYSALSALSPALLRHSHRYKPAIIGQPLRFQGATFHFVYSFHTIPCIGFRVEWRGRSIVFTADHFNSPPAIAKLEETGVFTKARADDLRNLPLQETDVLLHEAGVPPIHTPIEVLKELPQKVKDRLYVVHTSALPPESGLKVAPTGTAGTIRLDQNHGRPGRGRLSLTVVDDDLLWNASASEYSTISEDSDAYLEHKFSSSFAHMAIPSSLSSMSSSIAVGRGTQRNSVFNGETSSAAPLVSLRPSSSTDAWYILNLLSAVPFLSSLSYASTMEVLETAKVDAYSLHEVVVPAVRRSNVLCVIWEGTCIEHPTGKSSKRVAGSALKTINEHPEKSGLGPGPVWHAGDWTGPISLQPEVSLSGESSTSKTHDIIAMSPEGVKVITIDFPSLHAILKSGSLLYRRFLDRNADQERAKMDKSISDHNTTTTDLLLERARKELNVLELLNCNSALRKLTAVQKRHLESLAVGPVSYQQGERLWAAGTPVDKAFIIISGTASFVQKRRNANSALGEGVGFAMKVDAETAMRELGVKHQPHAHGDDHSSMSSVDNDDHQGISHKIIFDAMSHDYKKLQKNLQTRADFFQKEGSVASGLSAFSGDSASHEDVEGYESDELHNLDHPHPEEPTPGRRTSLFRRRSSRLRQANKVLGRLYSRRAFTGGLVFSRGHFLGDVSKMVAGLLSSDALSESGEGGPQYGFGDKDECSLAETALATITEAGGADGDNHIVHNSTLTAGKDGCVVLVFPKGTLIPFLDEYPGLLLSLLGTQVVV